MAASRPAPMLTTIKRLLVGHSRFASESASSTGLLYVSPPSTKVPPGGGMSILIGLKNIGVALVARPASQIAQGLGL